MTLIKGKRSNKKPEEVVVKFIIDYLVDNFNYNKSMFRINKKLYDCNVKFRPDIVVYDVMCNPFMVIECKAVDVNINENSLFQILNYNNFLSAKYILITNKIKIFCWKFDNGKYVVSDIPQYSV